MWLCLVTVPYDALVQAEAEELTLGNHTVPQQKSHAQAEGLQCRLFWYLLGYRSDYEDYKQEYMAMSAQQQKPMPAPLHEHTPAPLHEPKPMTKQQHKLELTVTPKSMPDSIPEFMLDLQVILTP